MADSSCPSWSASRRLERCFAFSSLFNISENWKGCVLPVSLDDVGHIHRAAGDVCSQGGLVKNIITAWSKSQDKKWEEACALGNWTRPSLSNAMQSMMVSTGSYLCKSPHHYYHDYLQKLITEARWRRCQYRPNISASATVSPDASLPTKQYWSWHF